MSILKNLLGIDVYTLSICMANKCNALNSQHIDIVYQ